MIQKVSSGRGGPVMASVSRQPTANESPETWGSWSGTKYYSLEVVQDPIRARMCGFGDKDRRPLAPAAVAKMIVQREDHSLVDVDEIDCSFFLVTVDLWSQDGKHEMNLVLHPTSADRYVPSNTPKAKRRGTTTSVAPPNSKSSRQSPAPSTATPSTSQAYGPQSTGMTPYMTPTSPAGYGSQGYPFPAQNPPSQESNSFHPIAPYGPPAGETQQWGYQSSSSVDRSSHQQQSHGGEGWNMEGSTRDDPEGMSYRSWPQDASYSSMENNGVSHGPNSLDPSLRGPQGPNSNDIRDGSSWNQSQDNYNGRYSDSYGPVSQQTQYAQQQHQQQSQSQYQTGVYPQQADEATNSTIPPLPRHTYTRTLVGPLSANACRLLDEHRKPGIFFLFQDLSIRTEGSFRLRLRLMNVGAPPAPESGATRVHTDVTPVLAQTFTQPFIVYSAKRFPGVPDTTALSIALGNQGQKLPLRNRNGSSKQGRKRQRSGSDGSGDDSDGE
ncbi:Velvet domain-containing protein [Abortiporus biennis]